MQKLPVETLLQTFRAACTDGGHTGCTLSRTSRAVSYPVLLHRTVDRLRSAWVLWVHFVPENERSGERHTGEGHPSSPQGRGGGWCRFRCRQLRGIQLSSSYPAPAPRRRRPRLARVVINAAAVLARLRCPPHRPRISIPYRPHPEFFSAIPQYWQRQHYRRSSPPSHTKLHMVMSPHPLARAPFSGWITHAPRTTHLRISFPPLVGINQEHMRSLLRTPHPRRALPAQPMRTWPSVRHSDPTRCRSRHRVPNTWRLGADILPERPAFQVVADG